MRLCCLSSSLAVVSQVPPFVIARTTPRLRSLHCVNDALVTPPGEGRWQSVLCLSPMVGALLAQRFLLLSAKANLFEQRLHVRSFDLTIACQVCAAPTCRASPAHRPNQKNHIALFFCYEMMAREGPAAPRILGGRPSPSHLSFRGSHLSDRRHVPLLLGLSAPRRLV